MNYSQHWHHSTRVFQLLLHVLSKDRRFKNRVVKNLGFKNRVLNRAIKTDQALKRIKKIYWKIAIPWVEYQKNLPFLLAECSGVQPCLCLAFTLAPYDNNNSTNLPWPFRAAKCNGVHLSMSSALALAPDFSKNFAAWNRPASVNIGYI